MELKRVIIALTLILTSGCSTVTISPKGVTKYSTEPTYEDSKKFYLLGLVGENDVDVKDICGNRPVRQIQTQDTFLDSFLTIITLTIYSPRTVKVWCGKVGA